jgi:hypothetical protein
MESKWMKKFKTLEEVATVLGNGGPFNPDISYDTIEDLVDALVSLGNTPKVYEQHDDHNGLKSNLPDEFLTAPLNASKKARFEEYKKLVLEQANTIIPLSEENN